MSALSQETQFRPGTARCIRYVWFVHVIECARFDEGVESYERCWLSSQPVNEPPHGVSHPAVSEFCQHFSLACELASFFPILSTIKDVDFKYFIGESITSDINTVRELRINASRSSGMANTRST